MKGSQLHRTGVEEAPHTASKWESRQALTYAVIYTYIREAGVPQSEYSKPVANWYLVLSSAAIKPISETRGGVALNPPPHVHLSNISRIKFFVLSDLYVLSSAIAEQQRVSPIYEASAHCLTTHIDTMQRVSFACLS
jgi:hypothetical protein